MHPLPDAQAAPNGEAMTSPTVAPGTRCECRIKGNHGIEDIWNHGADQCTRDAVRMVTVRHEPGTGPNKDGATRTYLWLCEPCALYHEGRSADRA